MNDAPLTRHITGAADAAAARAAVAGVAARAGLPVRERLLWGIMLPGQPGLLCRTVLPGGDDLLRG